MEVFTLVIRTKPELSSTESLAESLNQSNDINTFLREVRKQFRKEFCDDWSVCWYYIIDTSLP